MLNNLFLWVLNQCLPVSMVILAVLLVRLFLKKAPKIFSYSLWGVVLFRLLCPISLHSPVGLLPQSQPVSEVLELAPATVHTQGFAGVQTAAAPGGSVQIGVGVWSIIWAAGVLLLLGYSAVCYIRLHKTLSESVREKENIYLCDGIATPFVLGLFRPRIYLPSSLSGSEKEYILCHEKHHIRRGDPIWKALGFLALCLYWFHPLVWVAFCLAGKDMEMSCDEAVVKALGGGVRADYAQSLLNLSTGRRIIGGTPLAFGEGSTGSRIRNLMSFKKPVIWVVLAAALVTIGLTVSLVADRPIEKEDGPAPQSDVSEPQSEVKPESEPQSESQPASDPGQQGSFFEQQGSQLTVDYRFENGQSSRFAVNLPEGVTAQISGGSITMDAFRPDETEETDLEFVKDGQIIGSLCTMGFGLEDPAEIAQIVDPAKSELPMPIFAGIALPNHADIEDYTVVKSGPTGAAATAKYAWQDMANFEGAAAAAPWLYRDCVLGYDWQAAPVFFDFTFEEGILTSQQLTELAESIEIAALTE